MRFSAFRVELVLQLAAFAALGSSATVYVTDLPIYSSLAPCAAWAVSYEIQGLTESECNPLATALESCVCTKDNNRVSVSSAISSNVLENCHSTATDDVTSAAAVLSAYCNQAAAVATAAPATNTISQYITDFPAYSDLAPCAENAVSYVVQGLTDSKCPSGASALASCACTKDQNSLYVSEQIGSNILSDYCGTTHSEDVASAQAVFAAYCGLGANNSPAFPTTSALPGDVTYYITDLPNYSSLASCAQYAVSYPVLVQTDNDCPAAPLALVSCACVKDQNSQGIVNSITSQVAENCGKTASEDVTSALAVFAEYCSAGKGLVTPKGVTASVTTTPYGSGTVGGGYTFGYSFGPTATGSGSNPTGGAIVNLPGISNGGLPIGAIAGGVAGGVVFIIFMAFVGWRYRRRSHKQRPTELAANESGNNNDNDYSKAELPNTEVSAGPRSSLLRKPIPSVSVTQSPVSPLDEEKTKAFERSPQPTQAELDVPNRVEVPGGPNAQELPHNRPQYEVQGSNQFPVSPNAQELPYNRPQYEVQGSNQFPGSPNAQAFHHDRPQYEVPGSNQFPVELNAPRANMNEGPFEMDGRPWE